MAVKCLASIGGCALRGLRLESTGHIAGGATGGFITPDFTVLTISAVTEDGEEIKDKDACGRLAANLKNPNQILRYTGALTMIKNNPPVEELLGGGRYLKSGEAYGGSAPQLGTPNTRKISLEIWTKANDPQTADLDVDFPYFRYVLPGVTNIVATGWEISNTTRKPQYTFDLLENPNWLNGPEEDPWPDDDVAGIPLTDRAYQWINVATLPDVSCGYLAGVAS